MFKFSLKACLSILIFVFVIIPIESFANERYPEVTEADSGNIFIYMDGKFAPANKEKLLNRLNQIRKEAFDEGLSSEYIPLKWSTDLEFSAQIRSVEAYITMNHKRLTDKTIWTAFLSSKGWRAENLAWNYNEDVMEKSIEQYYSEKADYIRHKNGANVPVNDYGHYQSIINPKYTHVGMGGFIKGSGYNSSAQLFASDNSVKEDITNFYGNSVQILEAKKSDINNIQLVSSTNSIPINSAINIRVKGKLNYDQKVVDVFIKDIKWISSDNSIATVDDNGNVKGVKEGRVTISAMSGNEIIASKTFESKEKTGNQSVFVLNQKTYTINGEIRTLATSPYTKNGRTMLPVRAVADSLGLSSQWDNTTKTATFTSADKTAVIKVGQSSMIMNNEKIDLFVPAEIKGGSVMIELRSLASAFGVDILWNNTNKSITVN